MKEAQIQRAIMDYLAAERIPAWRMNTGAVSGEHNGKRRFFRFGQKGMADILAAPDVWIGDTKFPVFVWIECKRVGGVQSEEQKSFMHYVSDNKMFYLLATSVDDVMTWMKANR